MILVITSQMKKYSITFILLCLAFCVKGQVKALISAHIDTVYSQSLKENRPVWIYSPDYDTTYFTKPQYPVLYLLDGDGYFASLVTMVQQLSSIVILHQVLPIC